MCIRDSHKTKNLIATVVGEVFGTSILGGLCAWPVAIFLMGKSAAAVSYTHLDVYKRQAQIIQHEIDHCDGILI